MLYVVPEVDEADVKRLARDSMVGLVRIQYWVIDLIFGQVACLNGVVELLCLNLFTKDGVQIMLLRPK